MDCRGRESKSYFADVAASWDEMRAGFYTDEMRDDAIGRAHVRPDAIVADIGTGTGFLIRGLAPQVSKVYGFDESPEMLAVARRNLSDFPNVELIEAPGHRLPLPDGALDAIFANMYLHHVPDPAGAIAEMARVLRPGGVLVLVDADEHDQIWMREAMADRWLGFKRSEIRAWFDEAGLIAVSVDCAKNSCCPTTIDGHRIRLGVFVAVGFKP